jgi:F5/8 type C domain
MLLACLACLSAAAGPAPVEPIVVDLARGPTSLVAPAQSLGAGLDGMERGGVRRLFTPHNLRRMKQSGLGALTYRLRTELAIEAWHWSEEGAWSDAARRRGYWTSTDHPRHRVLIGWGYRLPRRGDTIDQAGDRGWSRLDDGDPTTFWKTNPYLDPRFTGEARARPQWAVIAFATPQSIDAARLQWAQPFARHYQIQYWTGADEYDADGRWVTFPRGDVTDGQGGVERLRLAAVPVETQFLRILLLTSSATAPRGSSDPRDRIGFAIGEVGFGLEARNGGLVDVVRHAADHDKQTLIYVSSTDPWHRAIDRDVNLEQAGFDRVYASGLGRGLPVMIPVGALYDTPANAAAEIRFLRARGYPVRQVEIGEEPDGQNVTAEDFGALYLEFAKAIHDADPRVKVGGPSLQLAVSDTWLDEDPDHSWTRRFVHYLKGRDRLNDLRFFTFERYPFDDLCGPAAPKLLAETTMMQSDLKRLRQDEVPRTIPWVISEYGFSAFGAQPEVEISGALINADIPAQFLTLGGSAAYLFGYGPNWPFDGGACASYGNLMLFEADASGQARWPMPSFFAAHMLTGEWLQAGGGLNAIYPASGVANADGALIVSAFAARRPDGDWSLLLINRDPAEVHRVSLSIRTGSGRVPAPLIPLRLTQYGQDRYSWRPDGPRGVPTRDQPPVRIGHLDGGSVIDLPAYSITVVRAASAGN